MKSIILIGMLVLASNVWAQKKSPQDYIATYAALAQKEMSRVGVPASITLAQGILESESGNSVLSLKSNNHFGIKCKSNWEGEKVYHNDDARGECFRKYVTVEESFIDHSDFLRNNSRYASLFNLDKSDYKGWAKGLKAAGYATNPQYAYKLIDLIEKYELFQFDNISPNEKSDQAIENPIQQDLKVSSVQNESILNDAVNETNFSSNQLEYNKVIFINQTKAIKVAAGTSLLSLAMQHSLSLNKLLEFNDFEKNHNDILEKDELIFLQRKRKVGAVQYHLIKTNESLHDIAQMEGIRLESLLVLNKITKEQKLKVGDKLILQNSVATK